MTVKHLARLLEDLLDVARIQHVDLAVAVTEAVEANGAGAGGHDVSVAIDGPQGVNEARAQAPDVVIIDIGLPGLDGYEVARRIRKSLGHATVLIALTGYGDREARRRTMEAGFDHHVVKPVDPMDLIRLAD